MASTYSNSLRLELIASGEAASTWGDKTNVNLTNIAAAFGYATQDGFAANADSTTTVADGVADPARAMYFKVTSSATLTATRTLTIAPNTISRLMWIENATNGGQSIAISQGTGANVTIPTGKTAVVYLDGAGSGAAVVDAMAGVDPGVTDTLAEILAAGNTTGGRDLAVSTGDDITFADNSKAIFGDGSDFEIYFNGNHGVMRTASASVGGNIYIQDDNNIVLGSIGGENYLNAAKDGAVTLYYDNAAKLATTSTGIEITGTATMDGLVVDGNDSYTSNIKFDYGASAPTYFANWGYKASSDGNKVFLTITDGGAAKDVLAANYNGSVGIGTSSIDGTLHVHTASAGTVTASSQADDLVIENSAEGGMTIITPDNQSARIRFTSPSTNNDVGGATIFYRQNINKMLVGTAVSGGVLALASGAGNESLTLASSGAATFSSSVTSTSFASTAGGTFTTAAGNDLNIVYPAGRSLLIKEGSETHVTVDNDGDVGIGNSTVASTRFAVTGSVVGANIETTSSTAGHEALIVNRQNSDGTAIAINKAGSTVGSIFSHSSGNIGAGTGDTGVLFAATSDSLQPWNTSTNAARDASIDLGVSGARFKDIFLSGGVNFSANANAGGMTSETLDDYEYGTWTPAIAGCTISIGRANYIKIGGLVKLDFNVVITGNDSSGAAMTITGVPFTATSANSESTANPMIRYFDFDSGTTDVLMYHYSRVATIEFYEVSDDANWSVLRRDQITNSSAAIIGTLIITVD